VTGIRLAGAVLAGGASSRMGSDKALLDVDGRRLVEVGLEALDRVGVQERTVIGARAGWPPDLVARLGAAGIAMVPDTWPGEGPLGGIVSALRGVTTGATPPATATADRTLLVLPCDLATVSTAVLARLVDAVVDGATGAVLCVAGRPVPVIAALRTELGAPLEAAFLAGDRRADAVLRLSGVVLVDAGPDEAPVDLDDPDDLARWRSRASGRPS
jgi:molybdopterin-guanine dinucleotide biosynthesis protein A